MKSDLDGIDVQCDQMGVIVENPYVCGKCFVKMEHVAEKSVRCPKCGLLFKDV